MNFFKSFLGPRFWIFTFWTQVDPLFIIELISCLERVVKPCCDPVVFWYTHQGNSDTHIWFLIHTVGFWYTHLDSDTPREFLLMIHKGIVWYTKGDSFIHIFIRLQSIDITNKQSQFTMQFGPAYPELVVLNGCP